MNTLTYSPDSNKCRVPSVGQFEYLGEYKISIIIEYFIHENKQCNLPLLSQSSLQKPIDSC